MFYWGSGGLWETKFSTNATSLTIGITIGKICTNGLCDKVPVPKRDKVPVDNLLISQGFPQAWPQRLVLDPRWREGLYTMVFTLLARDVAAQAEGCSRDAAPCRPGQGAPRDRRS